MSAMMIKRSKRALVLSCAMLIFLQLIIAGNPLRAYAAQGNDTVINEDNDEYIIDDEDEDDDDGEEVEDGDIIIIEEEDDTGGSTTAKDDNQQGSGQTTKQSEPVQQTQPAQQKSESQPAAKAKIKHRKLAVEVSSNKPNYYDKMAVTDELRITVKAKGKKIKNKYLKFSSNKKSVATVNENGVITARKNGTARIKIVNKKKKSQKCFINITVAKNTVRTLYIGDSRSVDLFSAKAEAIYGEVHNDVVVCALNGGKVTFLNEVINHSDLSDYDTIVTWMGCNDFGAFKPYAKTYNKIVSKGKKLILCSVGPTDYGCMDEGGQALMNDRVINGFNSQLKFWADKKDVKTVPMYEYVSKNVSIDHVDGVHYSPKPNKPMWNYILDSAN